MVRNKVIYKNCVFIDIDRSLPETLHEYSKLQYLFKEIPFPSQHYAYLNLLCTYPKGKMFQPV